MIIKKVNGIIQLRLPTHGARSKWLAELGQQPVMRCENQKLASMGTKTDRGEAKEGSPEESIAEAVEAGEDDMYSDDESEEEVEQTSNTGQPKAAPKKAAQARKSKPTATNNYGKQATPYKKRGKPIVCSVTEMLTARPSWRPTRLDKCWEQSASHRR